MVNRIMGDSVELSEIPLTVDVVATYVSGDEGVVTDAEIEARFPITRYGHVTIDVNGSRPDANVRDWETGDKSGSLETWVADHNKSTGVSDAVIYCNVSTIPEVRQLTGTKILGKDYWLWIATLDGMLYQAPGVIACQNRGAAQNGANYDTSEIFDDRFFKSPIPKPIVLGTKPNCTAFQRAIRVLVDNVWGPVTDDSATALISSWSRQFPNGIAYAQHVVGTTPDGVWGPKSITAAHDTTAQAQRALISMGYSPGTVDGIWGPHTNEAYMSARKACHI